ncbi:MAG: GNAT family N-acetyltransferase [Bacteroidota bacterium]|jgi:GNAT superfamily N-acetyltransferase|nr:MAG: GNAT family N-acetyltransferase [Bacteroidota bacterium]
MEQINTATIEILDFRSEDQIWFERLNREWIEKYFHMEPVDVQILTHPEEHIIKGGGVILMARQQGRVVGTVALRFVKPAVYEFTKMAVAPEYRGRGIGRALSEAAIARARSLGATKIILYSARKLEAAINLYRTMGFTEVPVDGPYKRSDIKLELTLQ